MSTTSFESIVGEVHTLTGVDVGICQMWVRDAFRRLAERRPWSWRMRKGYLVAYDQYATGTIDVQRNSTTIGGNATVWTADMVGRQIRRPSTTDPIYTITRVDSGTSIEVRPPWGSADGSAQAYSIFNGYLRAPDDCFALMSVVNPQRNWRMRIGVDQAMLDYYDPQRTRYGAASVLAGVETEHDFSGKVYPVRLVDGSGLTKPQSAGSFSGIVDSIFTIVITTGGASGVAQYKWRKNEDTFVTGVVTDLAATELADGVYVSFPTGTYILNDTFVVQCSVKSYPTAPLYELYPHQTTELIFPCQYVTYTEDLDEIGARIPRSIRGDVIRELALIEAATYPGTDEKPNPYAQVSRREFHVKMAEYLVNELEREDNAIMQRNTSYRIPYAPLPWDDPDWDLSQDYDPPYIYS